MANKYYLSFADNSGFLGACLVEIELVDLQPALIKLVAINPQVKRSQLTIEMAQATIKTHRLKINPGGEIKLVQVPADLIIPEQYFNRLLSRADIAAMDAELLANKTTNKPAD